MSLKQEKKTFSTVETLNILLQYRGIMSEVIRKMDMAGHGYTSDVTLHRLVLTFTEDMKSDIKRKIRIGYSLQNLLQANIVVNVDHVEGEKRLFFHESILGVIRLCDISLTQQLTDSQLRTQLTMLAAIEQELSSGVLSFNEQDPDYTEAMENLMIHLGNLLSLVRQNVLKMEQMTKDLENLTSKSIATGVTADEFMKAKEGWLDTILNLYERHIMPTLTFLNPESTYKHSKGLHHLLESIANTLKGQGKDAHAGNIEQYALSFLNMYKPIESVASTVNRFIHRERDSIRRFNAFEHFYQHILKPEFAQTQGANLNRTKMSDKAIVLPDFSPGLKGFMRPQGYALEQSSAYYANLFNELEARTRDIFLISNANNALATASKNDKGQERIERAQILKALLEKLTLRQTDDLTALLHERLSTQMPEYQLHDLLTAMRYSKLQSADTQYNLKATNVFATIEASNKAYDYRKIRCSLKENEYV